MATEQEKETQRQRPDRAGTDLSSSLCGYSMFTKQCKDQFLKEPPLDACDLLVSEDRDQGCLSSQVIDCNALHEADYAPRF
eukprot:scaffold32853_cov14-Tisochrysis_lutea.AAC.1